MVSNTFNPSSRSESFESRDAQASFQPACAAGDALDKALLGILEGGKERLLDHLNERILRLAFHMNGQNQVRTAKALGVSRNTLRTFLKRYGMIV